MPTPAEVIFSTPCYIKRKVESKQYILNWRLTFHVTSCVKRQNMFRGWHSRWRESCTWCRGATHQGESFLTISHVQHCRRPNITLQVFCESESYSIAIFSLTLKISSTWAVELDSWQLEDDAAVHAFLPPTPSGLNTGFKLLVIFVHCNSYFCRFRSRSIPIFVLLLLGCIYCRGSLNVL